MNNDERWKQRFQNFEKAYNVFQARFDEYKEESGNDAYKMALIQAFEIIFELSWKTLKDYLESHGVKEIVTPKNVLREAFKAEMLTKCEVWISALEKRNQTIHTYNEDTMSDVIKFIENDFYSIVRDLYFQLKKEI